MTMSIILTLMLLGSLLYSLLSGTAPELAAGLLSGAEKAVKLAFSLAGPLCLWGGVNALLREAGALSALKRVMSPLLRLAFPSAAVLGAEEAICANVSANLLGLGNAATAPGLEAARLLAGGKSAAGAELCRFVVMNTASVQLVPATVCAVRASAGASAPFDILPAVWLTSLCALAAGLGAARIFEKLWKS